MYIDHVGPLTPQNRKLLTFSSCFTSQLDSANADIGAMSSLKRDKIQEVEISGCEIAMARPSILQSRPEDV